MLSANRMHEKLDQEDIDVIVASDKQNVFYTTGLKIEAEWSIGWGCYSIWSSKEGGPFLIFPAVDSNQIPDSGIDYEQIYSYNDFYYYVAEDKELAESDQKVLEANDEIDSFDTAMEALCSVLDMLLDEEGTIAVEKSDLSSRELETIENDIDFGELIDTENIFTELRKQKTDEEVDRLSRSVEITEESIEESLDELTEGITENKLARIIQRKMMEKGATEISHMVVGFGTHSAHCHPVPYEEYGTTGKQALKEGDLLRIDAGCIYKGYVSDIARTYAFKYATDDSKKKYEIVYSTNEKVASLMEDGKDVSEIFEAGINHIQQLGSENEIEQFKNFNRHHLGHAIGINIYDSPQITPQGGSVKSGMVMNAETPYYELGTGGIQVEDTLVVEENGARHLSQAPDSLQVIE